MTHPLAAVLDDLATLVAQVTPDQAARPTPCDEYDVAALRQHVLSWLPVFATALTDPDGDGRPDPAAYRAPDGAAAAAAEVRESARQVQAALDGGVEDAPVRLLGSQLPGQVVVGMLTAEVIAHGWDLARATGLPWQPGDDVCKGALTAMDGMLKPEYRGEGKSFGIEVPAGPDASALDHLLAFSGRDPGWTPPPAPS